MNAQEDFLAASEDRPRTVQFLKCRCFGHVVRKTLRRDGGVVLRGAPATIAAGR
jgi:hypothetical protein